MDQGIRFGLEILLLGVSLWLVSRRQVRGLSQVVTDASRHPVELTRILQARSWRFGLAQVGACGLAMWCLLVLFSPMLQEGGLELPLGYEVGFWACAALGLLALLGTLSTHYPLDAVLWLGGLVVMTGGVLALSGRVMAAVVHVTLVGLIWLVSVVTSLSRWAVSRQHLVRERALEQLLVACVVSFALVLISHVLTGENWRGGTRLDPSLWRLGILLAGLGLGVMILQRVGMFSVLGACVMAQGVVLCCGAMWPAGESLSSSLVLSGIVALVDLMSAVWLWQARAQMFEHAEDDEDRALRKALTRNARHVESERPLARAREAVRL